MKRRVAVIAGVLLAIAFANVTAQGADIGIMVSPGTLYLESQGTLVTVHADIPYAWVDKVSLQLNGVDVDWTKADNQGNLVAKFELDAVKAIVAPPSATLTLSGTTFDGTDFSGTDTIKVVAPRRQK